MPNCVTGQIDLLVMWLGVGEKIMQIFYSFLITAVSLLTVLSGYDLFGIEGLLFTGFGITFFILGYFRWELYERDKKRED